MGFLFHLYFCICFFFYDLKNEILNYILVYSFIISIVGLIDDKINLNAGSKLFFLIFPIYLLSQNNLLITNIGYFEYYGIIELKSLSIPFTLICCLLLINAVNYFDGIDGFASLNSVGSILSLIFLVHSQDVVDKEISNFLLIILTPIIIFLFFNLNSTKNFKVFLGDSGSLMLGFLISFMIIFIFKNTNIHPALLIWSISFFVFEFLSVNLLRIFRKKPLFKPGKDHFHYQLLKSTRSLFLTNICGFVLNITLFFTGFLIFSFFGPLVSIALYVILFLKFFVIKIILAKGKLINL